MAGLADDPLDLWKARRWRRLLLLIDNLPRHSAFAAAVADDDEYAEMLLQAEELAERQGRRSPLSSSGPSMATWTAEVGIIADLIDAITVLRNVTIAANSGKDAPRPEFKPYPRPRLALDRVREARRWEQHNALADRVLARRHRKTEQED